MKIETTVLSSGHVTVTVWTNIFGCPKTKREYIEMLKEKQAWLV